MRDLWRRWAFGLPTVTGLARRGWFIPYRYAASLPHAGTLPSYAALLPLFDRAAGRMIGWIDEIDRHGGALRAIGGEPAPAPRWSQDWFPRLDAAAAYAFVRRARPRLVIEVGSGHSTRFLSRAMLDGDVDGRILAIDPAPRASVGGLPRVELLRDTLHKSGDAPFAALEPGDLLFIDSSHILMPGSDVDHLFNRVLPILPAGVHVHLHDIFLPDDYPAEWTWRGYNEQLGVAALLQGGGFEIEFSSRYAATRLAERIANSVLAEFPLEKGAFESSLWLVRR